MIPITAQNMEIGVLMVGGNFARVSKNVFLKQTIYTLIFMPKHLMELSGEAMI
jgi:hypothetical protein